MAIINPGTFEQTAKGLWDLAKKSPPGRLLSDPYNYLRGAFENYANRQTGIQQELNQAYQTGQVSPQLSSELIGNFPMGAEVKGLYHGSPYKFNKFAQEKIGTGEGAQAFGYGHYLTESPDIAQQYASELRWRRGYDVKAQGQEMPKGYMYDAVTRDAMDDMRQLVEFAKYPTYPEYEKMLKPRIEARFERYKHRTGSQGEELNALEQWYNKYLKTATPEQMNAPELGQHTYSTTVNKGKPSSADVFLEWDKPVNNEAIQRLIKYFSESSNPKLMSMVPRIKYFGDKGFTDASGEKLYNEIVTDLGGNKEAQRRVSDLMNRAGITGIKYPSGTKSGIKDSPYYNYVIFNPEDITIEAVK